MLDGKVAIVTGAASGTGLGLGIATLFHEEGAKVVIADVDDDAGEEVAKKLSSAGQECIFVKTNVTSAKDWEQLVSTTIARFGGLDILVNNTGCTHKNEDALSVSEAEYDRTGVFDVNVKSIYHSARATIPHFISQSSGSIIIISSCITAKATKGLAWYGASKGAVDMITRHLAREYSSYDIRVNAVAPSIFETPLMDDFLGEKHTPDGIMRLAAEIPVGRICGPEDIAKATLYLTASKRECHITAGCKFGD
ncbi:hypothetical protein LTR17_024849 [Elasticomyces elasticus]|nr:hypothetical protein LTR17_024849 [Elasticomyces elasticus]